MLDKALRDFAQEVDAEYRNPENLYTRDDRVILLDAIRACRRELFIVEGEWERALIDATDERAFTVEGVGNVQVRRGSTRSKWDHDGLTRTLTARALDERQLDPMTGEYEPAWEAVTRVMRECAGISYWKVTALRAHGVDPSEFCEKEPGSLKVTIS